MKINPAQGSRAAEATGQEASGGDEVGDTGTTGPERGAEVTPVASVGLGSSWTKARYSPAAGSRPHAFWSTSHRAAPTQSPAPALHTQQPPTQAPSARARHRLPPGHVGLQPRRPCRPVASLRAESHRDRMTPAFPGANGPQRHPGPLSTRSPQLSGWS